jgi:hypothetical protein
MTPGPQTEGLPLQLYSLVKQRGAADLIILCLERRRKACAGSGMIGMLFAA